MNVKENLLELLKTIDNQKLLEWLYQFILDGLRLWRVEEEK